MNRQVLTGFSLSVISVFAICAATLQAGEWESELGMEANYFLQEGARDQSQFKGSLKLQTEYYREWNDGSDSFTFTPFLRVDSEDSERTHGDIRALTWVRVYDTWELRTGIRKVYWGVTESQHLVDIVNQTDLVESFDGEEKLGQPMVNISLERDWGTLDLFWLIGFRERTFAGEDGRLSPDVADTDNPIYESSAEEKRSDFAIRLKQYLGDWELGWSHFSGTSRDPSFSFGRPIYKVIDQTGLDVQYLYDSWLLKLEVITRSGYEGGRYTAATTGLEYTQVGVFDSAADIGWIVEGLFDDRKDDAPTPNELDIMIGARLTLNDEQNTDALIGAIIDVESSDKSFSMEASRRLGETWKLALEARIFEPSDHSDFTEFDREDFLRLQLDKFF